jgi:hypothetical protein
MIEMEIAIEKLAKFNEKIDTDSILLLFKGRELAVHGEGINFAYDLSGILVNFGITVGESYFLFESFLSGFL